MLSIREKIAYGLGDAASNIVFQTVMLFLAVYYTDVVGLTAGTVGTLFLGVRVFDAFTDPLMGYLADRTETRWGKFRPYLLWLALPYALSTVLTFTSFDLSPTGRLVYAAATYALLMTVYTAINIPYSALGGVITSDPKERVSVQSYRFAMAWVGGLLVTSLMAPLAELLGGDDRAAGYQRSMIVLSIIGTAMFWACFLGTKERIATTERASSRVRENLEALFRNDQLLLVCGAQVVLLIAIAGRGTATIYFANDVLGFDNSTRWVTAFVTTGMLGNIAGGMASAHIAQRLEKARAVPLIQVAVAICCLVGAFVPRHLWNFHFTLHFVCSFFVALAVPMVWAMVADTVDYGALRAGRRITGLVFAANLFAIKLGLAVGGAVVGWLLEIYGYDGNIDAQSATALRGITLAFFAVPGIGALVAAEILRNYQLDQTRVANLAAAMKSSPAS